MQGSQLAGPLASSPVPIGHARQLLMVDMKVDCNRFRHELAALVTCPISHQRTKTSGRQDFWHGVNRTDEQNGEHDSLT